MPMSYSSNKQKLVFKGEIFEIYQWKQELYDGSIAVFEKAKRANSVIVVPFTKEGKLILVSQLQPRFKKERVGFPGGRIDEGCSPKETALRELKEETGYECAKIRFIKEWSPFPSYVDWKFYYFVATDCKKASNPTPEAGEKILEIKEVEFEKVCEMVVKKDLSLLGIEYEFLRSYFDKDFKERLLKEWIGD